MKNINLLLGLGFFPALILSWIFEITVKGGELQSAVDADGTPVKKATKAFDRIIMLILVAALGYFLLGKFFFYRRKLRGYIFIVTRCIWTFLSFPARAGRPQGLIVK